MSLPSPRRSACLLLGMLLCGSHGLQGQTEEQPAGQPPTTPWTGAVSVGFKAIHNEGDLNFFRERFGERAGMTLQSASATREWPEFRYLRVETLFTPEHNSRALVTIGSIENFRLRLKYDRIQNYYSTTSTNFTAASPGLFTLPGELTLRRTVAEVDWLWNIRKRAVLHGGYRLRRSNGSDLQLVGGSYFTVFDSSLPTRSTRSAWQHTYMLGLDVPVGRLEFHLLGEIETLNARDSFAQPQIVGIGLDRDLVYLNETHGRSSRVSATFDLSPQPDWFISGGYVFQDLANSPQWLRLSLDRNFTDLTRRGDPLRAEAQYHRLFGQAVYTPKRSVVVRYRVVQDWGDGWGRGTQLRFENPLTQALTESLESRTSFDNRIHREQVTLNLAPSDRTTFRVRYGYDRRARDYANFFTAFGLSNAEAAAVREGEQSAHVHTLQFEGRVRPTKSLQLAGGFGRRQFDIRERDLRLVRHYFLGDRETDTNSFHAGLKYRATRRGSLELDYRREERDYSALTSGPSPSRNKFDFDLYAATLNLHPTSRWFVFGLLHYIRSDVRMLDVSDPSRLAGFSPIDYLVSNTGYAVGASYSLWDRIHLGAQFQQNRAGGNERYKVHDAAASLEYELAERWAVGARYHYLASTLPVTPINNHRTHVVQGLLNYRF